jgi:two-component system chemotaxis response regulator CheV
MQIRGEEVMTFDAESYLKSGSNELRVLEYRTCGLSFGINILKVNKIVHDLVDFTRVPQSPEAISGMFKDRDRLVPVLDLAKFLGLQRKDQRSSKVIVTEFFGMLTGFSVERVDWIHHFQWADVIDAEDVFANIDHKYVIGIVKPAEDRMVLLLDYETILLDICPRLRQVEVRPATNAADFSGRRVLIAEDSPAVRSMLVAELSDLGLEVRETCDGKAAWETFEKEKFDLVVSDVEMPQMDGLALTLRIRQSDRPNTPVIVYSSIGDMGMKARAAFLKADAHITKLNLNRLVEVAGRLMNGEQIAAEEAGEEVRRIPAIEALPLEI